MHLVFNSEIYLRVYKFLHIFNLTNYKKIVIWKQRCTLAKQIETYIHPACNAFMTLVSSHEKTT